VDRNEEGTFSIVAIRVPPSMNSMEVLNEYFAQFGPVASLRINHNRHEAVISFGHVEEAEEALRWPVLNDPSIGLRPWRCKANGGGGAGAGAEAERARPQPGNMQLESGSALEKKRQREELEDRRKKLLQGLTDQLKVAMARINDPNMTEKNREKMQVLLTSIKEKITALTPQRPEPPEPPRVRWPPSGRPSLGGYPSSQAPGGEAGRTAEGTRLPSVTLRLTNLPVEMRGAEAEARFAQTLGEGVESVRSVSEDGGSCVVRFADRRHAEVALQSQKVWGYTAEWVEEVPEATPEVPGTAAPAMAPPVGAVSVVDDAGEEPYAPAPASGETEAMDSDIPDQELAGAMESAARGAAEAAARATAAQDAAVEASAVVEATESAPVATQAVEPNAVAEQAAEPAPAATQAEPARPAEQPPEQPPAAASAEVPAACEAIAGNAVGEVAAPAAGAA